MGLITAVNAGCFIGEELAKRISMELEGAESDEICSIPDYYAVLAQTYEKEKKQDYRLARFDGVFKFWSKRQPDSEVYIYIRFPWNSFKNVRNHSIFSWVA